MNGVPAICRTTLRNRHVITGISTVFGFIEPLFWLLGFIEQPFQQGATKP
jgi:hypothetical protein